MKEHLNLMIQRLKESGNWDKIVVLWKACVIICLAFLCACSPEQRLAQLVKNHPGLVKSDTLHIRDTTIIKGVRVDTLFRNSTLRDTLIVRKDQLTMKYFYHNDTAFLSGECRPDTIIKDRIVSVNTIKPVEKIPRWIYIVGFCFVALIIYGFVRK